MFIKISEETRQLFSAKKTALILICIFLGAVGSLRSYIGIYEGNNLCESVMFYLTNKYYILMLVPIMVLAVSSDKAGIYGRYVVLLRYRSRTEYYLARLCAELIHTFGSVSLFALMPVLYGQCRSLSGAGTVIYTQISAATVVLQYLNILCYAVWFCVLCEMLRIVIRNKILYVLASMGIPIVNLVAVKAGVIWLAKWLPWQRIALELYGWEVDGYRFHWEYWTVLVGLFWYIGDYIFSQKDIVYENG